MQRSLLLFENAINSNATMKLYQNNLENFMHFVGFENKYDEYSKLDPKVIDRHLEDYVMYHAGKSQRCYC